MKRLNKKQINRRLRELNLAVRRGQANEIDLLEIALQQEKMKRLKGRIR